MIGTNVPYTFVSWLSLFKGVDLPIGDLANDVSNDPDFPSEDRLCILIEYFSEKQASSDAIEALCDVWNFYKASTCEVGTLDELAKRMGI